MIKKLLWKFSKGIFFLLLISLFSKNSLAQTAQCIFSGSVQINGSSPPSGTQVNLLRSDKSFIRSANYNYVNGTFGVNAFNTDGLSDGDTVLFQVISDREYFVKTYGDNPIFIGTILPNPPKIINLTLFYLEKPNLLNPTDLAINLPIDLMLQWQKAIFSANYHIQISKNSSFSNLIFESSKIDSNFIIVNGLGYFTTYYWRVRSQNEIGQSDWSDVWQFTTIIQKPDVPLLYSPSNGAENMETNSIFVWSWSSFAHDFDCHIAIDSNFQNMYLVQSEIHDSTMQVRDLRDGYKFWWKVKAKNLAGESEFSHSWWFITKLNSPTNFVITDSSTSLIKLQWTDNSSSENGFAIERANSVFPLLFVPIDTVSSNTEEYWEKQPLGNGTFFYRIKSFNSIAESRYSDTISVTVTHIYDSNSNIPEEYSLSQNYPNPFNPSTKIKFGLPKPSDVSILIFDILGQLVSEILTERLAAGYHEVIFNASNLSSGIYYYSIRSNSIVDKANFRQIKKMILLK